MATTTTPTENSIPTTETAHDPAAKLWIVSPAFDLFFILNCLWPVLLWIGFQSNLAGHSSLQFWQIYFVTTPHRWITLFLVLCDRNRFGERPRTFTLLAVSIVGGCLLVQGFTGTLTCLLVVDYLWNAWHFAAQHHGIFRIYGRKVDRNLPPETRQKWLFRLSLLYVIFRVAGWSWQFNSLEQVLMPADYGVTMVLLGMLSWEWSRSPASLGRSGYLTSVIVMYLALLGAVHFHRPDLVLVLSTVSALFHATEYLAIISWNVKDRDQKQLSSGFVKRFAPLWLFSLLVFALVLGIAGWYANKYWLNLWIAVNVMMAFVHYSYDGLIWRRRPHTSS